MTTDYPYLTADAVAGIRKQAAATHDHFGTSTSIKHLVEAHQAAWFEDSRLSSEMVADASAVLTAELERLRSS